MQHAISINFYLMLERKIRNPLTCSFLLCTLLFHTAPRWSLKFPWVGRSTRFHRRYGETTVWRKYFPVYFLRNLFLNTHGLSDSDLLYPPVLLWSAQTKNYSHLTLEQRGGSRHTSFAVWNSHVTFDSAIGTSQKLIKPTEDGKQYFQSAIGNLCLGVQKYCFWLLNLRMKNLWIWKTDCIHWKIIT